MLRLAGGKPGTHRQYQVSWLLLFFYSMFSVPVNLCYYCYDVLFHTFLFLLPIYKSTPQVRKINESTEWKWKRTKATKGRNHYRDMNWLYDTALGWQGDTHTYRGHTYRQGGVIIETWLYETTFHWQGTHIQTADTQSDMDTQADMGHTDRQGDTHTYTLLYAA
jgi:hypothetical protein